MLDAVNKFWIENNLFQEYISDYAVPISNGKIAIDSVESLQFILGFGECGVTGIWIPCLDEWCPCTSTLQSVAHAPGPP